MRKRKDSQCTKAYQYMDKYGSITQGEADTFGCKRLAARISDLKKRGASIDTEMIKVTNADGSTSRIARYSLG